MTCFSENTMVENIPLLFTVICVFLSITVIQNVKLQILPDPCPGISAKTTADMCTNGYATEDDKTGGTTVDSVALRVTKQQDGCECEVTLQNQTGIYTLHMRKYDLHTNAAPENATCALAIDLDYNIPNNLPENKSSVECIKGTKSRSISLATNGILHLRSRVINGSFTRGYCMQLYRQHSPGDNVGIQINCFHPNVQTTKHTTVAAIQDTPVSEPSTTPTTQQTTYAAIQDKTDSDTDSALYIGIGVGSVVVVIALFVIVAITLIRQKGNKDKNGAEKQPEVDCTEYDSDGLKYNTLYNTSEQQDIMEGDYHTVELEGKQNRTGIQNLGSNSVVDGNYSFIDIVNIHGIDGSKTDKRIKSTSATTRRPETERPEEETSNTLKHVTEGSSVEYAIVDKSGRTDQNIKHIFAPNDSNVEYAVVDKK